MIIINKYICCTKYWKQLKEKYVQYLYKTWAFLYIILLNDTIEVREGLYVSVGMQEHMWFEIGRSNRLHVVRKWINYLRIEALTL